MKKDVETAKINLNEKVKVSQIYHEAPAVEPDLAPDIKKKLESCIVLDGSKYTFECIVIGTLPFEIKWFKNGTQLDQKDEKYSFNFDDKTGSISLVIKKVTTNENALFSCRVINELGMAETSAYLKVKGK